MAYGIKYRAEWASMDNVMGYLYIEQKYYVGTITDLVIKADSMYVNYVFGDWNNPIIGMQAEFEIINDKPNFYTLLPLLISEEKKYKIRIVGINKPYPVVGTPTYYTIFEGFLNCDTITQKILLRQAIKFAASSFLYKLEGFHPESIDVLQNKTFIDIIDEILRSTGALFDIRVNSSLHAEGDVMQTTQTLFNKNGFYTELFWEDEVTRSSSLDILKKILTSFDCYIYWLDGYWYIERYEDIWKTSKSFVQYTTGISYSPTSTGTIVVIEEIIGDANKIVFTNQSQTLSVIPGLKTIKINLDDKRVFNLVLSSLKDVKPTVDAIPAPPYRSFQIYQEQVGDFITGNILWFSAGLPKNNIANSIQRVQRNSEHPLDPLNNPTYRGLFTTCKITVDSTETQLNISFKYVIDLTKIAFWTKKWKDYSFDFNWFLRLSGTNYYIINSGEDWVTSLGPSDGIIVDQLQQTNIGGSNFDPATKSVTVSITIPIGLVRTYFDGLDVGTLLGDQSFVFGLGLERFHLPEEVDTEGVQVKECWIGDVVITTTGGTQNNVIEGKVNTSGFLNTKEISMSLYDIESYNYKNGILRGDDLSIRTERWGTLGGDFNVLQKGVCWNTSTNPTIDNFKTNDGSGLNVFTSSITGLIPNTTYYVRAYYITETGVFYGDEKSFTTKYLQLGDYHQGGIIFYFLQLGDTGYDPLVRKGLIAAVVDQSNDCFYASLNGGYSTTGATGQKIGEGLANTNLMDADYKTSDHAVKFCLNYECDGYTDYYMPSIRELEKLFLMKDVVKGFSPGWYWSSTECKNSSSAGETPPELPPIVKAGKRAWAIDFSRKITDTSYIDFWDKNNHMRVRAIRSFIET